MIQLYTLLWYKICFQFTKTGSKSIGDFSIKELGLLLVAFDNFCKIY